MSDRLRFWAAAALACLGMVFAGCEQKDAATKTPADAPAKAAVAALPPDLFVLTPPEGARGVGAVKADADATGDVVIHGRLGGRKEPFVDGFAVFLLADVSMSPCGAESDNPCCATPWDYCCEPRESLAAKTATIQVVGANGKPLRTSLEGQHGLKPLKEVTVAGKVAQRDDAGTLVINANRIHVKASGG